MSRSNAHPGTTAPLRLPAEEMPVGVQIDCGSYEITEHEIIEFGTLWDPQYFHIDPDAAAHSTFGGVIASGVHTTAIFQRLATLAVYNRYDVIAGREIRALRFLRPVRAGDVLTGTVLLRSVEPARLGRCLVTILGALRNQAGEPVLELEVDSLVRSATPSAG
ncbi:MAG: MaoC/PaaZ C-terminal domain-containing protein [Humibacillus sp.]